MQNCPVRLFIGINRNITRIYGNIPDKTGFDRQTVWEFEKIYLKLISIENHLSINSKTAIPGLNDTKCRRVL